MVTLRNAGRLSLRRRAEQEQLNSTPKALPPCDALGDHQNPCSIDARRLRRSS